MQYPQRASALLTCTGVQSAANHTTTGHILTHRFRQPLSLFFCESAEAES